MEVRAAVQGPSAVGPADQPPVEARRWVLAQLQPTPEEEWERLRGFLELSSTEQQAMLTTVEVLLSRGQELVAGIYDHLLRQPETAALLGWEAGAEPAHLAERRRFLALWLGRTLGMDFSHDLARYLFRAGQLHAAHGPRMIHVPPVFIAGAISLVLAAFARYLSEAMPGAPMLPTALAGWQKVLTLHQHLMLTGYQTAIDLDSGDLAVPITFFGRLRGLVGRDGLTVRLPAGAPVELALRRLFNYCPVLRTQSCEVVWQEQERLDRYGRPWLVVEPAYRPKSGWRLLVNGRDIAYGGGLERGLETGDSLQFFPPGR